MNTAHDQADAFSTAMDQSFARLAQRVSNAYQRRLLCERRLDAAAIEPIRTAASLYLAACLGLRGPLPAEAALLDAFTERKDSLANLTPNGVLMPKREFTAEFNLLHKAVAAALGEFLPDDLVESVQSLMMFRIVDGTANPRRDQRPYATAKMHTDVWAGDPIDAVTVIIPVLGDPANLGVEFYEMPRERELEFMHPLDDYSLAGDIQPLLPYDGLDFRIGSVYFFDVRLLHQTMRRAPGYRISLDFRLRRKMPPEARTWLDRIAGRDNDRNPCIDYPLWKSVGTDNLLVVAESSAEARARFARPGPAMSALPRILPLK